MEQDNKAEIQELCDAMFKLKGYSLYGKAILLWRQGYRKVDVTLKKEPEADRNCDKDWFGETC